MDGINNNLSTPQYSPALKELLERRSIGKADDAEISSSKDQIEEITANIQTGEMIQDPNVAADVSEVIAATMNQSGINNINFNNNSEFGSGNDDGHDTSEARKIKSELMASA
ncbi:MAG: hypothetical protein HRT47_03670 [Candidatus Caenarcaniphilales bacterium]|nr:hypothetical protein [Candidatus Caenarcaniphilales bacterium]